MPNFDLMFPSQEMVTSYVDKHAFDKEYFVSPQLGIEEDDISNLDSPGAIMWDVLEPTTGMTMATALDAAPKIIKTRVRKTITHRPLFFRESYELGEKEMLFTRRVGSSVARAGDDLIYGTIDQANDRIDCRIEASIMEMLTGSLHIDGRERVDYGFATEQKPDVHTTYGSAYWDSDSGTTPIADIRRASEVLRYKGSRGTTMVVDVATMALISRSAEDLLKQSPLAVELGPERLRDVLPGLLGCGISRVIVGNQGYADDNGETRSFVPQGHCFLVGQLREGEPIGAFRSVPNLYSGVGADAKAGRFVVVDNVFARTGGVIPKITITAGIYGLPVLYRPDLVVAMKVLA